MKWKENECLSTSEGTMVLSTLQLFTMLQELQNLQLFYFQWLLTTFCGLFLLRWNGSQVSGPTCQGVLCLVFVDNRISDSESLWTEVVDGIPDICYGRFRRCLWRKNSVLGRNFRLNAKIVPLVDKLYTLVKNWKIVLLLGKIVLFAGKYLLLFVEKIEQNILYLDRNWQISDMTRGEKEIGV